MGENKPTKWIFVSGGVLSGLGKGVVSASIARLLLNGSRKVVTVKCDGYLNVDPGTMNPIEHGEVFVLDDGAETDMDFGHYERFTNNSCKSSWSITSGKIFSAVIEKERRGDYLGKTVQMIPHVTNQIKDSLYKIARDERADIMIVELGGTVGDIEMMLFYEAARQLRLENRKNFLSCHLTYVPELDVVGEQKTKPTQQSVAKMLSEGIQPDVVIGRSKRMLDPETKRKIALFGNMDPSQVISNPDLKSIYELPLIFHKEGLTKTIASKLTIAVKPELKTWSKLVSNMASPTQNVHIAICGKYTQLQDSYVSIFESLNHCGAHLNVKVTYEFLETSNTTQSQIQEVLSRSDGIIVPGGFGKRGVEGKIAVIKYARENNIPFLGICLGLQLAVVEFARHVCNLKRANSTEFDEMTPHKVIDILEEQKLITAKGATMRLGAYPAVLKKGSKIAKLYKSLKATERHRHRYEVNPTYHELLESQGLVISGKAPDRDLAEFIELPNHPYFVATQAHPELKSTLEKPAPLFYGLVQAALRRRN